MKADALQLRKCPNREEFEFMLANFSEKYSHLAAGRDFIRDYGENFLMITSVFLKMLFIFWLGI